MTDPTARPSPGAKAIAYAENDLGVHAVYEGAVQRRNDLDALFSEMSDLRDRKRNLESALADRELEISTDEHGKHDQMSVAGMERHLKLVLPKDTQVRRLREDLGAVVSDIEGLEYDIRIAETDIKIAASRLQELGGYLQYLAAIKQAATSKRTGETSQ